MTSFQTADEGRFLTAKQAAEYLGIKMSYLYKLTHQRTLPYYKPNGKLVYFLQSDLLNFLSGNRISAQIEIDQIATDYIVTGKELS
jgi:excisionase family DNA binding protein